MSQGLIGGTLWGVLAAGFGLVVVSQIAPPPQGGPPVPVVAEVPAAAAAPVAVAASDPVTATAPQVAAEARPAPAPAVAPAPAARADPAPVAVARVEAPQLHAPLKQAAPSVSAAADAPASEPARAALPQVTARVADDTLPGVATAEADAGAELAVLPEPATPVDPAATAAPAPAPGPKFVSVVPRKPAPADSAPADPVATATAEPVASTPPKLASVAPAVVAAATQAAGRPDLPGPATPPAALPRPAAMLVAGPAPAAPVPPVPASAPTVVVTQAPRAVPPATLARAEGAAPAPAATARGGFLPGLIVPAEAPAADLPPVSGSPPPPLTPEEMAILAKPAAVPAITPDQGLPDVIVLTEAADPAKPSILKKPVPLKPTPSLAAKGQVPATEGLPKIVPVPPTPAPETASAPEAVVPLPDDAPPIDRFARPFDNVAGKPLFAVVLIDTGDPQIDRAALAAIPFPVTFALDPTAPESALAASIYRAAGQEVVMLATGLPAGATAADLEVSFGAHEAALPEAVAVLDLEAGGFQADRPLSTLVVPVLKGQGRGLLSWDRGLNAASQVARREGLRSGVIFRRLDGEGEPVAQMRRYLDRAAFKAAQDGRVIVAGETRANTVQALLEWAVEGRASSVALAPLTAVLRLE